VFVFAGPTATVTVATNTDRLVGSAEAPLGLTSGANQNMDYGLCYQTGASTVTNFVGGAFSTGQVSTQRESWAAAASVVPGAGTYQVGFCVRNNGPGAISNNDFVNGWVMVVDPPEDGPITDNVVPRP
jgi:hypothetical protein